MGSKPELGFKSCSSDYFPVLSGLRVNGRGQVCVVVFFKNLLKPEVFSVCVQTKQNNLIKKKQCCCFGPMNSQEVGLWSRHFTSRLVMVWIISKKLPKKNSIAVENENLH